MTGRDDKPSIREIAEFTRRLRELSKAGRDADPDERAAFLAEKDALIARIEAARQTNVDDVLARAEGGGYAMVGPSARTWSVDPAAGVPVGPVPEAEHRMVRDLIAQEWLDGAEPAWLRCADGGAEIVSAVVPFRDDEQLDDEWSAEGDAAAHPDEPGRVDAPDAAADVDGRLLAPWPAGTIPPEMLDGIEERRTAPAQPDDPAEIHARIEALRQQIYQRDTRRAAADDVAEQLTAPARTRSSVDAAADEADGNDSGRGW